MRIKIDGTVYEVTKVFDPGYLPMVELDNGEEYYLAENAEHAGAKAREYYEDMAHDDPKEFTCLVGEETLIRWGLGQSAGPGSAQVESLADWLDLVADTPEETWGSWDGSECTVDRVGRLCDDLGFRPTVAYRHN